MKFLIINADDFGYGCGVNRAIAELHDQGVVTSASLMVNTPSTAEGVAMAAARPALSLGLHVNFTNEAQRLVDFDDPAVCRRELRRQFDHFVALTGRPPTHLDSHQHVHRRPPCQPSFLELALEYGLPLRDRAPVTFKGGFYGQWEYGISEQEKVSFEALTSIVSTELRRGIYELAVHPGYLDAAATTSTTATESGSARPSPIRACPRCSATRRSSSSAITSSSARSRASTAARPERARGAPQRRAKSEISVANSTPFFVPWIVSSRSSAKPTLRTRSR